jgi:hypothetical protein
MAWLLLEGYNDQRQRLTQTGIVAREFRIQRPRQITGILFPENRRNQVFRALGLNNTNYRVVATDRNEVMFLEPTTQQPAQQGIAVDTQGASEVRLLDRAGINDWEGLLPVIEKFAQATGLRVAVRSARGTSMKVNNEPGRLFIRFYCTSGDRRLAEPINLVYGINLGPRQRQIFSPTLMGTPIVEDRSNRIIAEHIGSTLNILFNLSEGDNAPQIMTRILERVGQDYGLQPGTIYAQFRTTPSTQRRTPTVLQVPSRTRISAALEAHRQAYARLCQGRRTDDRKNAREQLQRIEKELESLQQKITTLVREQQAQQKVIDDLQESDGDMSPRYMLEFDKLSQTKGIEKVEVDGHNINVFTENIDIRQGNSKYRLGKFRIQINTSRNKDVRCFNLSGARGGYYHPHVREGGWCCWGNISTGVQDLLRENQWAALAQLVLRYLQTWNRRDPYYSVTNWPKVNSRGEVEDALDTLARRPSATTRRTTNRGRW